MKDKKIEITVETYEVLLIKQRGGLSRSWCKSCSKQVTLIGLDDACALGLSAETISQRGETGRIHLIEIAGEPPFICLNSLIQTWEETLAAEPAKQSRTINTLKEPGARMNATSSKNSNVPWES